MRSAKQYAAYLLLTLACAAGSAYSAPTPTTDGETLPPEALRAIEALSLSGQPAAVKTAPVEPTSSLVDARVLGMGLGVIAGVVTFNLITGGVSTLPLLGSAEEAAFTLRLVTSAVIGGLVGDYAYRSHARRIASVPANVANRVTP